MHGVDPRMFVPLPARGRARPPFASLVVAVLYARRDSHYKGHACCDVFDIERDARTWRGGVPVIAHPPCRAWGRMRDKAQPRPDEAGLALLAVAQVRCWGGVLEHPQGSRLWDAAGLPKPGQRDAWGGWTLPVSQHWWGHRAEKMTWLYVVGCEPWNVPDMPLSLADPVAVVAQPKKRNGVVRLYKGMPGWKPEISRSEREKTPPDMAAWLIELAKRCYAGGGHA